MNDYDIRIDQWRNYFWLIYAMFSIWECLCYYCVKKYHEQFGTLANYIKLPLILSTSIIIFIQLSIYYFRYLADVSHKNYIEMIVKFGIVGLLTSVCWAILSGWVMSQKGIKFLRLPIECFLMYTPSVPTFLKYTIPVNKYNFLRSKWLPVIVAIASFLFLVFFYGFFVFSFFKYHNSYQHLLNSINR